MHIIAGQLRRRKLRVPKGLATRPTTGRVREAMFSALENRMDLSDIRVLDLFAGTGALGLEALSRGARQVIFVDSCANVLRVAQDNAKLLGVKSQCIFLRADAMKFLQGLSNPFDLILADPPYAYADLNVLVAAADRRLVAGGLLVLEHDARIPPTDAVWNRRYGRTGVAVYRHSK